MTSTHRRPSITGSAFRACIGTADRPNGTTTIGSSLDGKGGELHLTHSVEDWLVPGCNPFGLYLSTDDVDAAAAAFARELAGKRGPEEKPWGTYEFALADPDQTLVRVGRRLQP